MQRVVFTLVFTVFIGFCGTSTAQLPICNNIYFLTSNGGSSSSIYTFDPKQPPSATNPKYNTCSWPWWSGGLGLAVSPHLGNNDPRLTFYSVSTTGKYIFYDVDSAKWVNTGHSAGSTLYISNIAAGGGYIYSIALTTGDVFRYDGYGNSVWVMKISDAAYQGPVDLIADCLGNFYLFRIPSNNFSQAFFRKYSPVGTLLQTWTVTNPTSMSVVTNAGMAVVGNQIYFDSHASTSSSIVSCTVGSNVISIDSMRQVGLFIDDDMASCAGFGLSLPSVQVAASDTSVCSGQPVHFTASPTLGGNYPHYEWRVNGIKKGMDSASFTYTPVNGDTVHFPSIDFLII